MDISADIMKSYRKHKRKEDFIMEVVFTVAVIMALSLGEKAYKRYRKAPEVRFALYRKRNDRAA